MDFVSSIVWSVYYSVARFFCDFGVVELCQAVDMRALLPTFQ